MTGFRFALNPQADGDRGSNNAARDAGCPPLLPDQRLGTECRTTRTNADMGSRTTLMYAEAAEAAAVAERQSVVLKPQLDALGRRLRELDPPVVITCARGSSDHAATFAKYLIEVRARTPVASFAPSTSSLYATPWRHLAGVLFLAISQSGRSPDILISARAAKAAGALVVAIVNDADSPLAEWPRLQFPSWPAGSAALPQPSRSSPRLLPS